MRETIRTVFKRVYDRVDCRLSFSIACRRRLEAIDSTNLQQRRRHRRW